MQAIEYSWEAAWDRRSWFRIAFGLNPRPRPAAVPSVPDENPLCKRLGIKSGQPSSFVRRI